MMTYDVYLEIWPDGRVMGHIPDLPGCFAKAMSEAQTLAYLRMTVPDYYRWLSMQDADTPTISGEVDLVVRERQPVTQNAGYEVRAFFAPDAQPVTEDDLDWGLALMSYAHQDVIRQVQPLTDVALDWQSDPQMVTIRSLIERAGQTDAWLARRLDTQPNVPLVVDLPGPFLERFNDSHERSLLRLSEAPPEMRSVIIEHDGERWSMRKVIRRAIINHREYAEQIAITLGNYAAR